MEDQKNNFSNVKQNVEIQQVLENIDLLNKYMESKTDFERDVYIEKMHPLCRIILQRNRFSPEELIQRLQKAIDLYEYAPRNLSLFSLALRADLDYISGEFDTFSIDLAKAIKNQDLDTARHLFDPLTLNRYVLAEQFAQDWMRRLSMHPDLIQRAKEATYDTEVRAYTELFNALIRDFCDDYKISPNSVNLKIVGDSERASEYGSYRVGGEKLVIPNDISDEDQINMLIQFAKSPKTTQGVIKNRDVVVNLGDIRERHAQDFFNHVIGTFVHEMNHFLDDVLPHQSALGPQVSKIDQQIYDKKNPIAYIKSATEMVSRCIQEIILTKLREKSHHKS
jgi:hypothetical protein